MKQRSLAFILLAFLGFNTSAFALTAKQKQTILKSFTSFSKECNCAVGKIKSEKDIDRIMKVWEPLVKSNQAFFNEMVNNLGRVAHIDATFTKKNDPVHMGYLMYMLKELAAIGAKSKKDITHKDLKITLGILKNSYGIQLPKMVMNLLGQVSHISTRKVSGQGGLSIILYTRGKKDISIDLTHKDLLGDQKGDENLLRSVVIKNGASIRFSSKWSGKGFDIREAGLNFFDNISDRSTDGKEPMLEPSAVDQGRAYFDDELYNKVGASPLYIQFSGMSIDGNFQGYELDPTFVDAVVLPGIKARGVKTFFIRSNVTKDVLFLRVLDDNVEVNL